VYKRQRGLGDVYKRQLQHWIPDNRHLNVSTLLNTPVNTKFIYRSFGESTTARKIYFNLLVH
jgi:hypothetical protein